MYKKESFMFQKFLGQLTHCLGACEATHQVGSTRWKAKSFIISKKQAKWKIKEKQPQ